MQIQAIHHHRTQTTVTSYTKQQVPEHSQLTMSFYHLHTPVPVIQIPVQTVQQCHHTDDHIIYLTSHLHPIKMEAIQSHQQQTEPNKVHDDSLHVVQTMEIQRMINI